MPSEHVTLDDLDRLPKELRELIIIAAALNWGVRHHDKGFFTILSPGDTGVQITVPGNVRSVRQSVLRTWWRKVLRYGDQVKLALIAEKYDSGAGITTMKEFFLATEVVRSQLVEKLVDEGHLPMSGRTIQQMVHDASTPQFSDGEPAPRNGDVEKNGKRKHSVTEQPAEVTLVSEKPWVARHAMRPTGGEVYESAAVVEQRWSDGSTSYRCSMCDFTDPTPRTVASHYGGKHGREKPTKDAQQFAYIDPSVSWVPTERQRGRIARLSSEISQARAELGPDATPMQIAEWIVQHRDEAREAHDASPLSPEQVLERIRRLVDGGVYADLMARIGLLEAEVSIAREEPRREAEELRTKLTVMEAVADDERATRQEERAEYEEALATMRKELHNAREHANRAEGDLDALRDMLNKDRD